MLKFLAVTDLHYSDKPETRDRIHPLTPQKLKAALDTDATNCDFIMNLGDTADDFEGFKAQKDCFNEILDIFSKYDKPLYTVIGNHDTAMPKKDFVKLFNMPNRYYSFDCGGYRCLVLDSSMNSTDHPDTTEEIEWNNCFIDDEQKEWLINHLNSSELPILIFNHELFVMHNKQEQSNGHLIINRHEFIDLFENCDKIKAVFCGHYHSGEFVVEGGVPYITFSSMCIGYNNNYAVVTVDENKIRVDGRGNQCSFEYKF